MMMMMTSSTKTPMATKTEPRALVASPPPPPPDRLQIRDELSSLAGVRVAVALSGGVDSAVAALELVQVGAEVVALALRLHDVEPDQPQAPRACCAPDDLLDARRVAEVLGIPFYVIDAREPFEGGVVRPFVESYLAGKTPNPCVGCNSFVKLGLLHRRARALGAARLATGHYARVLRDLDGQPHLYRAVDGRKDQSYFLFGTDREVLSDLCFPLGAMAKDEVRARALEAGLPVAHKLDSQEVCFVGGAGAADYVRRRPEAAGLLDGSIIDESGRELGRHQGLAGFTIGQRRGLGLGTHRRLFVLDIDGASRTVTVGQEDRLRKTALIARQPTWVGPAPSEPIQVVVKIRYRDPGAPALAHLREDGALEVRFEREVRAIAPGQAAVLYRGDEVLGGGWIEEAIR